VRTVAENEVAIWRIFFPGGDIDRHDASDTASKAAAIARIITT